MKHTLFLLLVLLTACKNGTKQTDKTKQAKEKTKSETPVPMEKTTYYFIRHAEKDTTDLANNDPHLTKKGLERAAFWAEFFGDKSLDKIYSTNYTRTIQTVIPLLDKTKLNLEFYTPHQLYSDEFLAKTRGKTVLIVGHQITLPDLMNKIIGKNKYGNITADVYGNLYTIILHENGSITSDVEQVGK